MEVTEAKNDLRKKSYNNYFNELFPKNFYENKIKLKKLINLKLSYE